MGCSVRRISAIYDGEERGRAPAKAVGQGHAKSGARRRIAPFPFRGATFRNAVLRGCRAAAQTAERPIGFDRHWPATSPQPETPGPSIRFPSGIRMYVHTTLTDFRFQTPRNKFSIRPASAPVLAGHGALVPNRTQSAIDLAPSQSGFQRAIQQVFNLWPCRTLPHAMKQQVRGKKPENIFLEGQVSQASRFAREHIGAHCWATFGHVPVCPPLPETCRCGRKGRHG